VLARLINIKSVLSRRYALVSIVSPREVKIHLMYVSGAQKAAFNSRLKHVELNSGAN